MIPLYVNMAEIQHTHTKEEGEMVIIRFFYNEHKLKNQEDVGRQAMRFPGPAVIMPKKVAKDFLQKFLGFLAHNEEWRVT